MILIIPIATIADTERDVLIFALGLDELSVAPSMVLKLRKIVREMKVEE